MKTRGFLDDLFGTIAGGAFPAMTDPADFIPIDDHGGTFNIKGSKASWMGLKNRTQQKKAYEFCFPVSTVIDRLAECDLTGTVEIFRLAKKGKNKVLESDWATRMKDLLANPNPLQGWYQFRGQQIMYKKVFGWCLVLPILPVGFDDPSDAITMVNIPPWCCEPEGTGDFFASRKVSAIKRWKVTILGKTTYWNPDQVFLLQDGFYQDESRQYLVPQSKLVGLDMAISNLCAAMEADNVLIKKKGPLGFVSHDAGAGKDGQSGYIPMSRKQKLELQRQLNRYGLSLSQYQYVISRVAVKYVPISYDTKSLQTKETVEQCERIMCTRYNYPYILYKESDATYANGDNAAASVYQTNVIPNANRDFAEYNIFFKAKENNGELRIDFSAVGALQEDKQMEAESFYTNNQALEIMWLNNQITQNQWLEKLGWEPIGAEGDLYFKDTDQGQSISVPLQVRRKLRKLKVA